MTPDDCPHTPMRPNPEGTHRVCQGCGLSIPIRTVAEHIAAMREVMRDTDKGER